MSFYTYGHCFICFKKEDGAAASASTADGITRPNSNEEIAKRFIVLSSRYLHLEEYLGFPLERTLKTKALWNTERACSSCLELLKSFCDMYHQIEYLKLQLAYRTKEIAQVIKSADKYDKDSIQGRADLEKKAAEMNSPSILEDVDYFRSGFLAKSPNLSGPWKPEPQIILEKGVGIQEDSDDEDFYQVITVDRDRKKKKQTPKPNDDKKPIEDMVNTAPVTIASEPSQDPSSAPLKKKISLKARPTSRIENHPDASQSQNKLETIDERRPLKRPFPHTSPSHHSVNNEDEGIGSSDFQSETTVTVLNDKTNVFSEPKVSDQTVVFNHSGDLVDSKDVGLADEQKCVPCQGPQSWPYRYNPPFSHLKYLCPVSNCSQTFTTMTRMTVHQQATGHYANAVINIVLNKQ